MSSIVPIIEDILQYTKQLVIYNGHKVCNNSMSLRATSKIPLLFCSVCKGQNVSFLNSIVMLKEKREQKNRVSHKSLKIKVICDCNFIPSSTHFLLKAGIVYNIT